MVVDPRGLLERRAVVVRERCIHLGYTPEFLRLRCGKVKSALRLFCASMRVYLCRHAEAAPGEPDELRELTANGLEQARRLGASLAALVEPPAVVLSSPLIRARQTAAEIANATGAPLRVEDLLAPGATAASLIEAIAGAPGPIATVGHQPDCSEIALELTGVDPGFPVAGSVELTVPV
jgi:phosphohistidine phosphatase SixA